MNANVGRLKVNVFAKSVGMPINNAKVTITDRDSLKTIEEFRTDSSGNTPTVELSAPPVEYSLEYSNQKPYSEYNVFIDADGFDRTVFYGVQIFSTSTAIQNATMNYRTEIAPSVQRFLIEEPVLWGVYSPKIIES